MAIGLVGFVLIMRAIRRVWLQGNDLLARRLCAGLLVAWLLGVFFLTLPGIEVVGATRRFNVIPFGGGYRTYTETVGNFLMFIPGGAVLSLGWGWLMNWRIAVAMGAVLSLAIEVYQCLAMSGRAADITDVILNSAGVALGYLLCAAWVRRWSGEEYSHSQGESEDFGSSSRGKRAN
ncbi:VanZ family protein [Kineosporia rhizophila]|uniref:VanZ family protein n=1 Tax=Kineosporia TaxID=49184 RepID=UPI001E372F2A|nr:MULTISPECIES: VanZ family protein [Kineosporia]MCE0536972.1 VanZ family protein [Kineosporia rhizophila]